MSNLNEDTASSQEVEQAASQEEQASVEQEQKQDSTGAISPEEDMPDDEVDQEMMVYPEFKDRVLRAKPIASYKTDIELIDVLSLFPYDIAQGLYYWQESFAHYKNACINRPNDLVARNAANERKERAVVNYCSTVWKACVAHGNALDFIEHALERYESVNQNHETMRREKSLAELRLETYYNKSLLSLLLVECPKVDKAAFTQVPSLAPAYDWLETFHELLRAFKKDLREEWHNAVKLCKQLGLDVYGLCCPDEASAAYLMESD